MSATNDHNHLKRHSSWVPELAKRKANQLVEGVQDKEIDLLQELADVLRVPDAKRVGPGGLLVLKRGGIMLLVMLVLAIAGMLINPTIGLVILFLAGAQLFATAYAYQVVAEETIKGISRKRPYIINLRMSLLGILMSFALALLAFIGLFF